MTYLSKLFRFVPLPFFLIVCFLIFAGPFRFAVSHFENGGYVMDSGWFATLLETTAFDMPNPKSIFTHSFYAHHISPILLAVAWLNKLTINVNGIYVFACLTGVALAGAFAIIGLPLLKSKPTIWEAASLGGVAIFFFTNEFIYRAIGYPHYELLFLLAAAIMLFGLYRNTLVATLTGCLLFILTREDGGLFAAYLCLCSIVLLNKTNVFQVRAFTVETLENRPWLFAVALISLVASFLSMFVQHKFFPEFGTFSSNFSGNRFSHVNLGLMAERLGQFMFETSGGLLLVATGLFCTLRRRLFWPLLLMSPLLLLHLLSVRHELAQFQLHYALPFVMVLMVCFFDILHNFQALNPKRTALTLTTIAVITSAPFCYVTGQKQNAANIMRTAHTANIHFAIDALDEKIRAYTSLAGDQNCGSIGVVAFEPGSFDKVESLEGKIGENCKNLLLFRGDLFYGQITSDPIFANYELTKVDGKLEYYQLK